ncbi:amidohydrolase family protein [bacterium]|nr:amidohydrolase family protein [bacterium]
MDYPAGVLLGNDVFGYAPGQLVAIHFANGQLESVAAVQPAEVPALCESAGDRLLDARGRLVLPGLIDAHLHAIATGMLMLTTDLHEVTSRDELAAAIRAAADAGDEFIRLGGLDPSRLGAETDLITRAWLDDLAPDRALYIKSVEGHSAWFNTRAWQRIGVDAMLEQCGVPPATQQQMYAAGRVYGHTYEELVTPIYDSYSFEERRRGMELVIAEAQRVGLTGLHCLEGYGEHRRHDFQMLLELDRRDDIDLTLYCRDATPQLALELGVPRFGGCWCVDGAIAAHSAALAEPYRDRPDTDGELYFSADELRGWLETGLRAGLQVCLHAIGERALAQALDAFEALAGACDLPALRPRLDHFVMGTPELAAQAARLGVISSMQPAFDARWGGPDGGYAQRLGSERALRSNPVGMVIGAGVRVAGGSDCYITPLDPLGGIRAALRHHNPAMRVDFTTAVNLFASEAAYFSFNENDRGRIAPGCQADFTIVRGTRKLDPEASVALTVKGGRVVYRAP